MAGQNHKVEKVGAKSPLEQGSQNRRFPPKNRACKFAIPVNRPVSPVNRSVFADSRKPVGGGFVNPALECIVGARSPISLTFF
jgi:hypothetical protein